MLFLLHNKCIKSFKLIVHGGWGIDGNGNLMDPEQTFIRVQERFSQILKPRVRAFLEYSFIFVAITLFCILVVMHANYFCSYEYCGAEAINMSHSTIFHLRGLLIRRVTHVALTGMPQVGDVCINLQWLERRTQEFEPTYLYTMENGYFLLPDEAKSWHNIRTANVSISARHPCFGNIWQQLTINRVVGYDTIIMNSLQNSAGQDYLVTKCGVLMMSLFVFFTTTMSVSFTLRETHTRMLKFTVQLQHHAQHRLPTFQLIFVHVIESLVFVPVCTHICNGPVPGPKILIKDWASLRPIWQRHRLCREFPETRNPSRRALSFSLAPSLSLSLPRDALSLLAVALSPRRHTLSLSSPAPCGGGGDQIPISSPLSHVSRSGSRSGLRWSVLNPSCSHALMSSTISNDQTDNYGYRRPAWWNPMYTRTQRTIKGKSPRGTCDIAITTRRFRCDKSGSARRTTLGYNGWEHTTSTTSRAMIGGSFIKEKMVRPKDEDMFEMQPPFCLIQKLKRSSAENSRRPETLAVELSLSLLRCLSLSRAMLSLSLPSLSLLAVACSLSPRRRRVVVVVTRSQSPLPCVLCLVSRSGSRSRLRWSVLNPSYSHALMLDEWITMHKNPHIVKWDLIMIGILFLLFEFYDDQLLAFMVLVLVWLCELFTLISLRTPISMKFFPRFFLLYFFVVHIYFFSYAYGFSYLALMTTAAFMQHLILYFWKRFELQHHAQHQLPTFQLIFVHVIESLVFVPVCTHICNGPVPGPKILIKDWASLRPIWQRHRVSLHLFYKKRCSLPFASYKNLTEALQRIPGDQKP
ncbi:hypothetical protein IGI04_036088 [Brassica rapa subsp. trilocularis]|uniref:Piezo non-specific cation channel R-Ras-binding domain-containing protein n=1 Tax=Brassica rapa subsp. trilocularis TaxID=1813537 RepID=A0ABQ7LDG9_BRACM|nr:hypothetical protein IGI04_036088 [Brassica rapa subsp. trilocularis]